MHNDDKSSGFPTTVLNSTTRRKVLKQMSVAAVLSSLGMVSPALVHADTLPNDTTDSRRMTPLFAYVGSRTTRERNARGEGITVYTVDQESGTLTLIQIFKDVINPYFLALNKRGDRLYTVHGDQTEVSAFSVDKATGKLTFLNCESSLGRNPVHLAIDHSQRFLIVSNYVSGSLAVLNLAEDGSIGPVNQILKLAPPPGPHRAEQQFSKPCCNLFDPSGRFVLVPDKGLDAVFCFQFDNGKLYPADQPLVKTREGAGPRHLAFHPRAAFAYVINELDSSITTYTFDSQTGALVAVQIVPSLPATFTGNSRASEIDIDHVGRFLYASNRGYDSVAVFAIDTSTGFLSPIEFVPAHGKSPRFVTLTPNEHFLFTLNEHSDTITSMAKDPDTGVLSNTGYAVMTGSPVCMIFSA